ncbi:MAG: hypothetical protein DYG94_09885 [Leptolyngbya sp. PLA3]|nr:MAG: hypothetical protein EDM82_05030 [Cyanobacteria bacterium CYA]MCE7969040.1 hypothetical protein [Leptolyngbya sp. PL-A3]
MAILAVVVMVAVIHLTVIGSVTRGKSSADMASLRIETMRALYAADSGVIVWLREDAAGQTPESGDELTMESQRAIFVESPEAGESGTLTVEGQSGRARRRVSVELE